MAALRYFFSLLMIPVSFVAAGISIAAYMAGQTNPNESTWITFIGLAMPVVLIINLVILVYWIIGKRWWAIVPVAAIFLNIGYLTSIFQVTVSSPETPNGKLPIRLASYNAGKFKSWEKFETQHYISEFLKNDQRRNFIPAIESTVSCRDVFTRFYHVGNRYFQQIPYPAIRQNTFKLRDK